MTIKLRKSNSADWKIIQQLNYEVYQNSFQFDPFLKKKDPFSKDSIKNYQQSVSDPKQFCYIAEIDGNPAGYLVGGENNDSYRSNRRGEIFHMGISPSYRSRGIGTLLVTEFKKWCKAKGLTHLAANTYYHDPKARRFYEKQGLSPIDITLEGKIS